MKSRLGLFRPNLFCVTLALCVGAAGLGLLGPGAAARGAVQPADIPSDVPAWLTRIPELASAPAPAWLRTGARLTYHVMSTAKKEDKTSGGEALVQYDVASSDGKTVLVILGIHSISGGPLMPLRDGGFIVGIPGVGEVWMNPAVLPTAEKHGNRDLAIGHTSMNVGGAARQAVRFEADEGIGRNVSVFDEQSGVLLYRINTLDKATQNTVTSQFMSMRQMNLAWVGGSTPAWAGAGTQLRYEGTSEVGFGYGPPVATPTVMLAHITQAGPTWAMVKWQSYLNGQLNGERYSLASATIASGGVFLPQAALATLKAGQVLDADPTTGVTVSVAQTPLSMDGRQLLTLMYQGQSFQRLCGYDCQSGMLVYYSSFSQEGVSQFHTELRLTGVSGK
ncbi:MAG: hypothetical protein VB144_07945 [Clostridia bacterium]|nr:hypothetical protein [Clostridia bacterium]